MPIGDLEEIVTRGYGVVGMEYAGRAPNTIAQLSKGFPEYTNQLALDAGFLALAGNSKKVELEHIRKAIKGAIEDTASSTLSAYAKGIRSTQKSNLYETILVACSLAEADDLGYFAPADIKTRLEEIVGVAYQHKTFAPHLAKFCSEERGPILERIQVGNTTRWRYRFKNPLMRPYTFFAWH